MRAFLKLLIATCAAVAFAVPAFAGNIALTGHDDDFHCINDGFPGAACSQLNSMVQFARSGAANAALPVLVFDQGTELSTSLTELGILHTTISTVAGVTAADFNSSLYSAFVVASDTTCGGCDNTMAFESAINGQTAAIDTFFNNGGGIVGLAGAANAGTYYNFLPESASGGGSPPSSGYTQTACGASLGISIVNGDPTHNFFTPGTIAPGYCSVEVLASTGEIETIALAGGAITTGVLTTGTPVPEPATLTLLGFGLAGAVRRRLRRA